QHGHLTRQDHKPNTTHEEEHVYVLTLKTTPSLAEPINRLREIYFPKHLNRTPAHLTFFHALPHSQLDAIQAKLEASSAATRPFPISTGSPFRMRRGVGINLREGAKESRTLHAELKTAWLKSLSEQDAGDWRAHWTVMNKVDEDDKVHNALEELKEELENGPKEGMAVGLDLWRYQRGNWLWAKEYAF
ncbi:2'-5' RNA ligase superfamily-domain-containing protein, partial [Clohesyomyces aquaticus]